jgi:hypothetical protein
MSLLDLIKVNSKLPIHEDYAEVYAKAEFCSESVECDEDYWETKTPNGTKMLVQFECEKKSSFEFRKDVSAPKNIMQSILNKYMSTALKNETNRVDIEFFKNVDLLGTTAETFFADRLEEALTKGYAYAIPDSTATDPNLTEAQKAQIGVRPYYRVIPVENVINWTEYLGHLQEAIVLFPDDEKAMYVNQEIMVEIIMKGERVVSIGQENYHGYSFIPLTRLKPFDNPFLFSGSLIQRSINQKVTLENLEIHKSTYTKIFLKGIQLETDENGRKIPISWGNDTILASEAENAAITTIGADVAQAASIQSSYTKELADLYQLYHLSGSQVAENTQFPSGYSLKISKQDFNAVCGKMVNALERFENTLNQLIAEKEALGLEPVEYSRDFIENDMNADILNLRDILSLDIGEIVKQKAREDFAKKYYNIAPEELTVI